LGCHPVAVVILHSMIKKQLETTEFKSGGLHEKHVEATWKGGNHLSIRSWSQGNQEKPVSSKSSTAPVVCNQVTIMTNF